MATNNSKTKRGPAAMTPEHKQALAVGRTESRVVRTYLEALAANRPKRGRKRTPESIGKRLSKIEAELESAAPLQQLQLVQEQMDLEEELATIDTKVDLTEVEAEFVKVARSYGERKNISYAAWRKIGVDPTVLRKAGIKR